jgi:hypothetical protein
LKGGLKGVFMTARRVTLCVFAGFLASGLPIKAQQNVRFGAQAQLSVKHDVSQPLRNIRPLIAQSGKPQIMLLHVWPHTAGIAQVDPALQTTTGPTISASVELNFEGLGDGQYGFQANSIPPDPNGSAGSTQFVEAVNFLLRYLTSRLVPWFMDRHSVPRCGPDSGARARLLMGVTL